MVGGAGEAINRWGRVSEQRKSNLVMSSVPYRNNRHTDADAFPPPHPTSPAIISALIPAMASFCYVQIRKHNAPCFLTRRGLVTPQTYPRRFNLSLEANL